MLALIGRGCRTFRWRRDDVIRYSHPLSLEVLFFCYMCSVYILIFLSNKKSCMSSEQQKRGRGFNFILYTHTNSWLLCFYLNNNISTEIVLQKFVCEILHKFWLYKQRVFKDHHEDEWPLLIFTCLQ